MIFPKPKQTLFQLLGPSVVFVAMSINGGELLLWPELTARHDLDILWAMPIVLIFQYFVNLEIERYTIVTGRSALSGLIGLQKWIAPLFVLSIIISLAWPAWASSAGYIMSYLFGLTAYKQLFGIGILLALLLIWQSKQSYKFLETISKFGLVSALLIIMYTIVTKFDLSLLGAFSGAFKNFGTFPHDVDKFTLLSALAFGGVVGVLNLVQSEWIKAKGYGATGLTNPAKIKWNSKSIRNFHAWWKLLKLEHGILYLLGNFTGILLLSSLAFLTISGNDVSGIGILTTQIEILKQDFAFLGIAFGVAIILIFGMAQMTILDAMGSLLAKSLHTKTPPARISQYMCGVGIIILALGYMYPNFAQPAFLLKLSASLSAGVMVLYTPLLLILNSKLPAGTRPTLLNKIMVIGCSLFYLTIIIWSLV
jgi:hypothetical protein